MTSDTGTASAKVSALLIGGQVPIPIGECVAVDHRKGHKVSDFETALDQVFTQFGDLVGNCWKGWATEKAPSWWRRWGSI